MEGKNEHFPKDYLGGSTQNSASTDAHAHRYLHTTYFICIF